MQFGLWLGFGLGLQEADTLLFSVQLRVNVMVRFMFGRSLRRLDLRHAFVSYTVRVRVKARTRARAGARARARAGAREEQGKSKGKG